MARKKSRSRRNNTANDLEYFEMALKLNGQAREDGPKRKTWNMHDLKSIKPLTPAQEETFHAFYNDYHICAHGSAGTGKTFIAVYLALRELLETKQYSRIIIVRSVVPTREVGHLPGTLDEKVALYELPYRDIFYELMGRQSTYDDMKAANKVEFMTTSFIRGLTWDNAIVIVDEGQNMTFHEIDSVMTRLGNNSKIIFTGDLIQTDLDNRKGNICGMKQFIDIIQHMNEFADIHFTSHDIVRSEFVKSWIMASEQVAA